MQKLLRALIHELKRPQENDSYVGDINKILTDLGDGSPVCISRQQQRFEPSLLIIKATPMQEYATAIPIVIREGEIEFLREGLEAQSRSDLIAAVESWLPLLEAETGITLRDVAMHLEGDEGAAREWVKLASDSERFGVLVAIGKCPKDARANVYRLSEISPIVENYLSLSPP